MSIRPIADTVADAGQLIKPLARIVAEYARNDDDYFIWGVFGRAKAKVFRLNTLPGVKLITVMITPANRDRCIDSWFEHRRRDPDKCVAMQLHLFGPASGDIDPYFINLWVEDLRRMIETGRFNIPEQKMDYSASWPIFTAFLREIRRQWLAAIEG